MTLRKKQITVLAVDDEAHGLSALKDIIQKTDNTIHCEQAKSVRSAVQAAKDKSISICVLDYHLGDGSAMDIISSLKMKHKSIIVSADERVAQTAKKIGIPFLIKPIDVKEFQSLFLPLLLNEQNENHE